MKLPATLDERRALRGLVRHARRTQARYPGSSGRNRRLVYQLTAYKKTRGTCLWCGDPTGPPRRCWHQSCATAYLVARGEVSDPSTTPVISREDRCTECGDPAREIDHRDSLGAASRSGSWRRLIRAYTVTNLRWLCRDCHASKTRRDRREQAELTRGGAERAGRAGENRLFRRPIFPG